MGSSFSSLEEISGLAASISPLAHFQSILPFECYFLSGTLNDDDEIVGNHPDETGTVQHTISLQTGWQKPKENRN